MEQHLRRLRQELLSMKEVGDGLQQQMTCMMGALQELKLLQLQTALEQLELSGHCSPPEQRRCRGHTDMGHMDTGHTDTVLDKGHGMDTVLDRGHTDRGHSMDTVLDRGHTDTGHTDTVLDTGHGMDTVLDRGHTDRGHTGEAQGHCPVPWPPGLSHPSVLAQSDRPGAAPSCSRSLCGQGSCPPAGSCTPAGPCPSAGSCPSAGPCPPACPCPPAGPVPVPSTAEHGQPWTLQASSQGRAGGWLLCQECPACDDGHDWTSSLMSQSRNRQPLVLGDNVFADLVGNWLDLPELDKKGDKGEALSPSRSQELCRKFSLTANIFKKFLRSVRPDRERLLKEKPCWLPPEDKQDIPKRSRKISKLKGTFYLPLHGPLQSHASKAERGPRAESRGEQPRAGSRKVPESREFSQAGFDINTAVWV